MCESIWLQRCSPHFKTFIHFPSETISTNHLKQLTHLRKSAKSKSIRLALIRGVYSLKPYDKCPQSFQAYYSGTFHIGRKTWRHSSADICCIYLLLFCKIAYFPTALRRYHRVTHSFATTDRMERRKYSRWKDLVLYKTKSVAERCFSHFFLQVSWRVRRPFLLAEEIQVIFSCVHTRKAKTSPFFFFLVLSVYI